MSTATIKVRFTRPGFHFWLGATGKRAYLSAKHRHLFHVEVRTVVHHDDREIEFHDLRDEAADLFDALGNGGGELGPMSCEMIARSIGASLAAKYKRSVTVEVSEDGEFAAEVCSQWIK